MKIHSNKEEGNTQGGATHPQPDYPAHQAALDHPHEIRIKVFIQRISVNKATTTYC